MRKIILFELNEVPKRILDEYCRWRPRSNFATRLPGCHKYETVVEDRVQDDHGGLSPWVTWPTLHRGVDNHKHGILDFGQDLTEVDREYPPLWNLLTRAGIRTGVCGSLHTYPLPANLDNYDFFLPDTFAAGADSFPEKLTAFQEFNLLMARESAKNVSTRVPWKAALDLLSSAPSLGLKASTFADVGRQLVEERLKPARKSRRRTYQSVLAFDVFEKFLSAKRPDFATFFSNHVASSMHRFWAAAFPGDYTEFEYDDAWIETYNSEICFAMDKADAFFGRLADFADRNPEYVVWVASSMGQAATRAIPVHSVLYVTEPAHFLRALGLSQEDWSPMPAMVPQYNVRVRSGFEASFRESLARLKVGGSALHWRESQDGFFSIDLGQINLDLETDTLTWDGERRSYAEFGLGNVGVDELTGSNAYHIPEGTLLVYDPRDRSPKGRGATISTLEVAPLILNNFAVPVPSYMRSAPRLEAVS